MKEKKKICKKCFFPTYLPNQKYRVGVQQTNLFLRMALPTDPTLIFSYEIGITQFIFLGLSLFLSSIEKYLNITVIIIVEW